MYHNLVNYSSKSQNFNYYNKNCNGHFCTKFFMTCLIFWGSILRSGIAGSKHIFWVTYFQTVSPESLYDSSSRIWEHLFNRQTLQKLLLFCPSDKFFKEPLIIWTYIFLILNYRRVETVSKKPWVGRSQRCRGLCQAILWPRLHPHPKPPLGMPGLLGFLRDPLLFLSPVVDRAGVRGFLLEARLGVLVCPCRWRCWHFWAPSLPTLSCRLAERGPAVWCGENWVGRRLFSQTEDKPLPPFPHSQSILPRYLGKRKHI